MNASRYVPRLLPGIAVDVAAFLVLEGQGLPLGTAQLCSFLPAAVLTSLLLGGAGALRGRRLCWNAAVAFAAAFLRGGVLASLMRLGLSPLPAILLAAPLAALLHLWGSAVFAAEDRTLPLRDGVWPRVLWGLAGYSFALRLCYMGVVELMHEEAYYWEYGQHPALGYYDHPPLVGYANWLCSRLHDTEFTVRLSALVAWLVAAVFARKLTRRLFGEEAAAGAVLLLSVLPGWFFSSIMMTPDVLVCACWAGALYFLHALLVEGRKGAWPGLGICFGLGLDAKYTIVLLAGGALLFALVDRQARRWLLRPQPWLAVLLAMLLFLPVVVWNAQNHWASFALQTTERVESKAAFELPNFILAVLLLLAPTGALALWPIVRQPAPADERLQRSRRLLLCATAVPAAVFCAFSMFRIIKLNWTLPAWLGVLPLMAQLLASPREAVATRLPVVGRKPWLYTAVVLLLIDAAFLHYLRLGIPGVPFPHAVGHSWPQGWPQIAQQIDARVREIETATGKRPLVVGMDQDRITGWLAFYRERPPSDPGRPVRETLGRHLFGQKSGTYEWWQPAEDAVGRTLILVGRNPGMLTTPDVDSRIASGGPVFDLTADQDGKRVRSNSVRIVEGYRGR